VQLVSWLVSSLPSWLSYHSLFNIRQNSCTDILKNWRIIIT
jgi:hypothetical protein